VAYVVLVAVQQARYISVGFEAPRSSASRGKGAMSTTWKTKWGARRVRREPPTIEEAIIAAEAMAHDADARAEIAAQLMGLPIDEVRVLLQRQQAQNRGRSTLVNGRSRAVVVEYKRPRTMSRPMSGPMGRR
jgi:hypothetical protein